jgi:hypothetical protein
MKLNKFTRNFLDRKKANYIRSILILSLPWLGFLFLKNFNISSNVFYYFILPFFFFYLFLLMFYTRGKCERCVRSASIRPDKLVGLTNRRCQFCGKSFIFEKFDLEFDKEEKETQYHNSSFWGNLKDTINFKGAIITYLFICFLTILLMITSIFIMSFSQILFNNYSFLTKSLIYSWSLLVFISTFLMLNLDSQGMTFFNRFTKKFIFFVITFHI